MTLDKLDVAPSEAVFIDDNMRHVDAAAKIGIHAIQFTSAERLKTALTRLGITV